MGTDILSRSIREIQSTPVPTAEVGLEELEHEITTEPVILDTSGGSAYAQTDIPIIQEENDTLTQLSTGEYPVTQQAPPLALLPEKDTESVRHFQGSSSRSRSEPGVYQDQEVYGNRSLNPVSGFIPSANHSAQKLYNLQKFSPGMLAPEVQSNDNAQSTNTGSYALRSSSTEQVFPSPTSSTRPSSFPGVSSLAQNPINFSVKKDSSQKNTSSDEPEILCLGVVERPTKTSSGRVLKSNTSSIAETSNTREKGIELTCHKRSGTHDAASTNATTKNSTYSALYAPAESKTLFPQAFNSSGFSSLVSAAQQPAGENRVPESILQLPFDYQRKIMQPSQPLPARTVCTSTDSLPVPLMSVQNKTSSAVDTAYHQMPHPYTNRVGVTDHFSFGGNAQQRYTGPFQNADRPSVHTNIPFKPRRSFLGLGESSNQSQACPPPAMDSTLPPLNISSNAQRETFLQMLEPHGRSKADSSANKAHSADLSYLNKMNTYASQIDQSQNSYNSRLHGTVSSSSVSLTSRHMNVSDANANTVLSNSLDKLTGNPNSMNNNPAMLQSSSDQMRRERSYSFGLKEENRLPPQYFPPLKAASEKVEPPAAHKNLKEEMLYRKQELQFLDVLASQKEAEYERLVRARAEKLRIINQLESKIKSHQHQRPDLPPPAGVPAIAGLRPTAQDDACNPTKVPHRIHKEPQPLSRKPFQPHDPAYPTKLPQTAQIPSADPPVLLNSAVSSAPSTLPSNSLSNSVSFMPSANIPLSVPLIGTGMFNVRSIDIPPALAPIVPVSSAGFPSDSQKSPQNQIRRKLSRLDNSLPPQLINSPSGNNTHTATQNAYSFMKPPPSQERNHYPISVPLGPTSENRNKPREPWFPNPNDQGQFQSCNPHENRPPPGSAFRVYQSSRQGLVQESNCSSGKWNNSPAYQRGIVGNSLQERSSANSYDPARLPERFSGEPWPRLPNSGPAMNQQVPYQVPTQEVNSQTPGERAKHYCAACGKAAVFLCSSCRRSWYCGIECQKKNWDEHSRFCGS